MRFWLSIRGAGMRSRWSSLTRISSMRSRSRGGSTLKITRSSRPVMPSVRTLPAEQQDRLDWLMRPVNEDDYDDEYEEEPIWEEIGYIEEASKRLIKEHPQEYRKIVESIDLNRLHREIDSLKGQIATRDNQIRKLVAKNPQNTNVPALLKTTETFRAELERLDSNLVKPKKKRPRRAKGA